MIRQINYILIFILSFGLILSSVQSVSAQSISELRKELAELESERSSIDHEESDAEAQIAENERAQRKVENKINEIDGELEVTEANIEEKQREINVTNTKISNLEASISETEAQISETESELETLEAELEILNEEIEELIERIAERDILIKNRLRSMQQNGGNINYLQVLFGAQSFGDFINRMTAVTKILDSDRTILTAQEEDKASLEDIRVTVEEKKVTVENKKEQLLVHKADLDDQKTAVENERTTLVAQQKELSNLKAQLHEQRNTQVAVADELEEEFFQLEELKMSIEDERQILADQERVVKQVIAEEQERIEKERLAQLAKEEEAQESSPSPSPSPAPSNPPSGGGALGTPVDGNYRISSPFGMRKHPITGIQTFHNGVDFARNPRNSPAPPIIASEAGIVVSAGWRGGYGNTVVIYHHDMGLTTLYAHLASMNVSTGQTVSKGQRLGIMGTTGNSTGIHLHYEVFEGQYLENRVNPMNYLR